jgi:hypothetical protein
MCPAWWSTPTSQPTSSLRVPSGRPPETAMTPSPGGSGRRAIKCLGEGRDVGHVVEVASRVDDGGQWPVSRDGPPQP